MEDKNTWVIQKKGRKEKKNEEQTKQNFISNYIKCKEIKYLK